MFVYAGIDEAGYGPFFGPLTVGRCVLAIPNLAPPEPALSLHKTRGTPDLWKRLNKAVGRTLSDAKGRVVVNDSKKLTTKAAGIRHLELGCLAFAALRGLRPADVCGWLDGVGEASHRDFTALPWYAVDEHNPWAALPLRVDAGELAIGRSMLATTCKRIGVEVADLGVAVVFEDRFNRMVSATRSKAAVSFTFVAGHLLAVWNEHGEHGPIVVVDRQSGRWRYRDLLALNFEGCEVAVLHESPQRSSYVIAQARGPRSMTVHFQTEAEQQHMPVALASMLAKYSRELMMERFKAYFSRRLPHVRPTAGYGSDAQRFWRDVQPELAGLGLDGRVLRRQA